MRRREFLASRGGSPWLAGRAPSHGGALVFPGRKERKRKIQGGGEVERRRCRCELGEEGA